MDFAVENLAIFCKHNFFFFGALVIMEDFIEKALSIASWRGSIWEVDKMMLLLNNAMRKW